MRWTWMLERRWFWSRLGGVAAKERDRDSCNQQHIQNIQISTPVRLWPRLRVDGMAECGKICNHQQAYGHQRSFYHFLIYSPGTIAQDPPSITTSSLSPPQPEPPPPPPSQTSTTLSDKKISTQEQKNYVPPSSQVPPSSLTAS